MLGAQLIPHSFGNPSGAAGRGNSGMPGLLQGFANPGNHFGQLKQADKAAGAEAGNVVLSRLVSSVEARFSASRVQTTAPVPPTAPDDDFSPQAVTDRVLGFVQQRIDKERANGASEERLQQLLDQAREGVEKGFAEARDIIVDQGLFTDEVKDNYLETVSSVQQGLDQLESSLSADAQGRGSNALVTQAPASSVARSSATRAASEDLYYNQTRSFDMQVKTRDGDLVTIRVNGEESLRSSSFAGSADGVAVSGFDGSYSNNSRFSFSVEGDLDEGELAALNDLFSQVNDIADTFYAGDVEAAFNQAMDVGYDASELAGFAVNMRRTEVVAVRQAYVEVAQYGGPQAAGGVPANPLQPIMDKLSDFAASVQQARASLLEGASGQDTFGALFADMIKSLVPPPASANPERAEPREQADANKPAFDQFIDTLAA